MVIEGLRYGLSSIPAGGWACGGKQDPAGDRMGDGERCDATVAVSNLQPDGLSLVKDSGLGLFPGLWVNAVGRNVRIENLNLITMDLMKIVREVLGSLLLLMGLFGLTACGEEDGPQTNSKGEVLAYLYDIEEQVDETSTKAPKSTWKTGDEIGVFCVEPGKQLGRVNYVSNYRYVYDGSKFKPATAADNIWISRQGAFTFFAYYPYDASKTGMDATAMEFTLSSDQSVEANRIASDIIAGQSYTADNTTGEVNMIFYHMMSDVRFVWTRDDAENGEYVRALFAPKAIVNLDQLTSQVAPGQEVGIGMRMNVKTEFNAVAGSTEYQVYVPPVTITHDQEVFVPYDANDSKLSSIKANLGAAGTTKQLERGKTYDLAGTMYTITADVRRNGDLVSDQCDDFDGCVVNADGGGDAGDLKQFVGRYLSGRTCTVTAAIGDNVVPGTQFIGWFEYDRVNSTWSKVEGATETYTFEVSKNRRLQARYENYVFGPWSLQWTHAGVSTDPNGNFTTTISNMGTPAGGLTLVPKATREVTLDGEVVTDPAFTTREGDQVVLAIVDQTPDKDMWEVNPWSYTGGTKVVTVTPNIDFTDNGTSGVPLERSLKLSVKLLNGGPNYDPVTHTYDDMLLTGDGGDMSIVQSKGTMAYSAWSVETIPTGNSGMLANGTTVSSVDAYAYRTWTLSGETVKRESTSAYTNITAAFTTTDSHWTVTPGTEALTKTVTIEGHEFTLINGRNFKVQAANNESLNVRNITCRFSSNGVHSDVAFSQQAGVKTNRSYSDWVIALTATPTTLEPYASSGTNNTSLITTSATRTMTFKWNATGDDKTESQTDGGSYNYGAGNTGTHPKVTWTVVPEKSGQFFAQSGNITGNRVAVNKNYKLKQDTPATSATVTATISNSVSDDGNGNTNSTKELTLTQKGGAYTETFDGWSGQKITVGSAINGDGGTTTFSVTVPTGWIRAYINGDRMAEGDYKISAKWNSTSISSSSNQFSVPNASSGNVSAEGNHGSTTPDYTSWSGGSASLSTSSFGRSGGSATISASAYPTREAWTRYNTSSRTATLTATFTKPDTHVSESYVPTPPNATATVSQNGSSTELSGTRYTESDTEFTCSENQSWSSVSGKTLSIVSYAPTETETTGVDAGSLSVSPTSIAATGGSISASAGNGTRYYDVYYSSYSRSGTVTITFSRSGISKTTGYTQSSSRTYKENGSTSISGSISWPSWASGGYASENTSTSSRSGSVTATYSYDGYTDYTSKTITQAAATITYGNYRITVSPTSMSWAGNSISSKSYTVSGSATKYINNTSQGTVSFSVTSISASCTGDFSGNSSSIWPDDTNETSSTKTGTATITGYVNGTKCTATISLSQSVREWNVSKGNN